MQGPEEQESYQEGAQGQDAGSVGQDEAGQVLAKALRDGWELPGSKYLSQGLESAEPLEGLGKDRTLLHGRGLSLCHSPSTVPSPPPRGPAS